MSANNKFSPELKEGMRLAMRGAAATLVGIAENQDAADFLLDHRIDLVRHVLQGIEAIEIALNKRVGMNDTRVPRVPNKNRG